MLRLKCASLMDTLTRNTMLFRDFGITHTFLLMLSNVNVFALFFQIITLSFRFGFSALSANQDLVGQRNVTMDAEQPMVIDYSVRKDLIPFQVGSCVCTHKFVFQIFQ